MDSRPHSPTTANAPPSTNDVRASSFARRVLMVCHDFPPCLSPGTFRALRFTKYLPEMGWQPIVLTLDAASLPEYVTRDPALLQQLSADLPIIRTRAWRPLNSLEKILLPPTGRPRPRDLPESDPDATAAQRPDPGQPHGADCLGRRAKCAGPGILWLRNLYRRWTQLTLGTPDNEMGWFLPAVYRGWRTIRTGRPQLIYTTGPPHSAHLIGMALHQLTGLPHVADLRDPWSRAPWGISGGRARKMLMSRLEEACVRQASVVILNTHRTCAEFRRHYSDLSPDHFQTVTNGFDPDLLSQVIEMTSPQTAVASSWSANQEVAANYFTTSPAWSPPGASGLNFPETSLPPEAMEPTPTFAAGRAATYPNPRVWTLCHPGHIYGQRSLWPLVEAIRALRRAGLDIRLEQIGNVEERQLSALLADAEIGQFLSCEPEIPHAELIKRMSQVDALAILQQGTALQVPSKLFEMMLFGKPLLAIADPGETADIIRRYGLGIIASAANPQSVENALSSLIFGNWTGSQFPLGQSARDEFDGRKLTAQLATLFDRARKPSLSHPIGIAY